MARRPRIALWGNFGTGNWGNECTLQAIVHNVRQRVPEATLLCICSRPDDTRQRHRVAAVPISVMRARVGAAPELRRPPRIVRVLRRVVVELGDWAQALRVARHVDMIVMTGTGMLTDDAEGPFGLPYDMFKWSVAAKAWRRKLSFVSVGVEPIRGRVSRFFIGSSLRLADYRSYRDVQSRQHLSDIGFPANADAVYPDLAFSLPDGATGAAQNAWRERPKVAVGVYSYRACGDGGEANAAAYAAYLRKLAEFVTWLVDRRHAVRIIIGDLTYDERVLRDLRPLLAPLAARHPGQIEDTPAASVEDVIRQIGDADIVVASRFHNVLLALLQGKPVVSLSYNAKNDALMGEMGLSAYCQTVDELNVERLIGQFVALERDAVALRPAIVARGAAYRRELGRQYEAVLSADGQ
jgi:polysaccharide pyruvyl transferase WcaK-like protein